MPTLCVSNDWAWHFPLSVHSSGRYIVDYKRDPWLMVADSPQGLIVDLTLAEVDTYLNNRITYGINTIQVHLLAGAFFGGRADRSTVDDIDPFSTAGDISTPNEAYFNRVDDILRLAFLHGVVIMLTAAENIESGDLFETNGEAKCTAFGQYLGNRYKDFKNIIWNYGNDYFGWFNDAAKDICFRAVCGGVQATDTNHLHTVWLNQFETTSRDSEDWDSLIDLSFIYSYYVTYYDALTDYARTPAKPTFLGEANYESEALVGYETTPFVIRKQNYWALLSGASGITYCNEDTWGFVSGWASRLDSFDGLDHTKICADLFKSVQWWNLVPDTTSTVITAGRGTYDDTEGSINTNDYATCAYIEGSLAIIYMPTNRTMTVDMTHFSGDVTCRWFDPTDGSYAADAASPHVNTGTHDFSHAGANAASGTDWVLVLEA